MYTEEQDEIDYLDTVTGTHQVVDGQLPFEAYQAARQGVKSPGIAQRYLEPLAALQDTDLELPENILYAYYAIYNLFKKYAQAENIDDWLIVNQALASEADPEARYPLLNNAIHEGMISRIPDASTTWQLWYIDTFDRDFPPSLEANGENILVGLYRLWLYTLREGIRDDGSASFSSFHLTWGRKASTCVDIVVEPFTNPSLKKLRLWANLMSQNLEEEDVITSQNLEEQRNPILSMLAQLHYEYLRISSRWEAPAIDWAAESRALLARVESVSVPEDLKVLLGSIPGGSS
jgi:hypothetical protein